MHKRTGLFAAAAVVVLCSPAFASDRGSMEDQLACTPDVYRLCSQYIPNEDSIVACLQRNVSNLSSGCRRVFERPENGGNQGGDDD